MPKNKTPIQLLVNANAHAEQAKASLRKGNCKAVLTHIKAADAQFEAANRKQSKRKWNRKFEDKLDQVLEKINAVEYQSTKKCRRGRKRALFYR